MAGWAILVNRKEVTEQKKDLEIVVGKILRWGVWISLFLGISGFVLMFFQDGHLNIAQLPTEPDRFSFKNLLVSIKNFEASGLMMLGVIALLLTPLIRVVFVLYGYLHKGNRLYFYITLIVFVLILLSVWIGLNLD